MVIVGGFLDPLGATLLAQDFRRYLGDDRVLAVSVASATSFEECRRRIVDAVDKSFPTDDRRETIEVDVVGISMGGLAARFAAAEPDTGSSTPRQRIRRLLTISSPLAWRDPGFRNPV